MTDLSTAQMVALSIADGYARLTNKPQCVLVHVDVGTSGMGAAVHNAAFGRVPVLIFAGLSPVTLEGETIGSRTEFVHWLQDVPDQKQIVAQYCRYVAEIRFGKNVKQMVNRALQYATSNPQGPAYLMATREVLEQKFEPYSLNQDHWTPLGPSALPRDGVELIANTLVEAKQPLVLVGQLGRKPNAVRELVRLADTVVLQVLDCSTSDMCFPASHPGWLGMGGGVQKKVTTADVIIVADTDVPWIPTQFKPSASCKVFHIDCDPLKQYTPVFYISSIATYQVDTATALNQLNDYISSTKTLTDKLSTPEYKSLMEERANFYKTRLASLAEAARPPRDLNFNLEPAYLMSEIRKACPTDTIFAIEAVTCTPFVTDHIQPSTPLSWINSGAGGLGWSGGAALGIKMGTDDQSGGPGKGKFVCQIVGDGSFMFSVPSTVYWMAYRYKIPILTIVLNNRGWNSPHRSMLLLHPHGDGSRASRSDLHVSFEPTPDYAGIARASGCGKLWAGQVSTPAELAKALPEAIRSVMDGTTAVLEAQFGGIGGTYRG